jgi:hypothetical protein
MPEGRGFTEILVTHGVDVPTGLAAAKAIDERFEAATSIRALQFHGDGTLQRVPEAIQRDLTRWLLLDLGKLPVYSGRRGLCPGGLGL